ncbi:Phenylacetate 2-hydroxylase [Spathaspora sp. JA1]|nr:Phenylacetate 2-hydroxylase [Spathaspora sp. JA1]
MLSEILSIKLFDKFSWLSSWLTHSFKNPIVLVITILTLWLLVDYFVTSPSEIPGIFSIPGCLPIVGNLHQVMNNPALVYLKWVEQYKHSIFQIRLGNKRIIVVNSFEDIVSLWIRHSCPNNSRPVSYTFHGIVSAIQGFTVGSTPASLTYKRKKKAISQHLNKRAVGDISNVIDLEIKYLFTAIIKNNELFYYTDMIDVDLMPFFQMFALRSSIFLAYGIHLDCYGRDREACLEIIEVENKIIQLRSPISNLQDSIWLLRYIPFLNIAASSYAERRNIYMKKLYECLLRGIEQNDDDCINSIIGDLVFKQSSSVSALAESEIQSICLTYVSAGLDNTPLNLNYLIGILSQPQLGARLQDVAINEIIEKSNGNLVLAWEQSGQDSMDVQYVQALVLETLRHFTVLPLSLPRVTSKAITHNNIVIPPGSNLFMNAYAGNHDPGHFSLPYEFVPERWIDPDSGLVTQGINHHFAFGAGSRMCSGYNLAFKELYMITCRILLLFEIGPPIEGPLMGLDPFENNSNPRATSFEPKPHHVGFRLRHLPNCNGLYQKIFTG